MKNKLGFKVNIGGETILYFIVGVIIFVFVLFMPKIYKFISDVKTGNAFKNNNPVVDNNPGGSKENNNQTDLDNDNESNYPKGDTTLVCTFTDSTANGNLLETYTFYFDSNKLSSFKNEKNYDAIADEYLNYVYSEQARFNSMNNLYKNVSGFSYNSTFESRNLKATFIYDLTKLNPDYLKNSDDNLSITLNVNKDNSLEDVKTIYNDLGYNCK